MALPSNALTTMDTARGELTGLSSAKDSIVERLVAVASDSIERHLGRTLYYSAAITETTVGLGGTFLFLSRTPLVSITSITLDGSTITSSTYSIHNAASGMVYRSGGWDWTALDTEGLAHPDQTAGTEQKLYSVVYVGGWVTPKQVEDDSQLTRTLPHDVEQACLDTVIHLFRGRGRARNLHKEAADVAGQPMGGGLPDSALKLLEPLSADVVSVRLDGVPELKRALKKYAKRYPSETARALYAEGFGIQQQALPLTPVEFAVLRTSAYTSPPAGRDGVVEVGYGTEYAIYQHEMMGLRHPRGGQAKYLETAINMRRTGMLERLAKRIQQNIESGQGTEAITPLGPTRPHVKHVSRKRKKKRRSLKARRKRR